MKLQKLVYYAQAWSLALYDCALFPDRVEAWRYGPVIPTLYALHKRRFVVSKSDLAGKAGKNEIIREPVIIELLSEISTSYGRQSGAELSRLSHSETPWLTAREGFGEMASADDEISQTSMRTYYKSQKARRLPLLKTDALPGNL